jgi:hypothetical protein
MVILRDEDVRDDSLSLHIHHICLCSSHFTRGPEAVLAEPFTASGGSLFGGPWAIVRVNMQLYHDSRGRSAGHTVANVVRNAREGDVNSTVTDNSTSSTEYSGANIVNGLQPDQILQPKRMTSRTIQKKE